MQRFEIGAREGLALVRGFGPLSLSGMRELRMQSLRLALRDHLDRVLCDLRGTVLMLGPDDWRLLTDELRAPDAIGLPTGYLVPEGYIADIHAMCDRLTRCGRVALGFTVSADAYRWLGAPASEWARREEVSPGTKPLSRPTR